MKHRRWTGERAAWGAVRHERFEARAHTGAVRVQVGDAPPRDEAAVAELLEQLRRDREFYLARGVYRRAEDRQHVARLFEQAIEKLRQYIRTSGVRSRLERERVGAPPRCEAAPGPRQKFKILLQSLNDATRTGMA